MDDDAEEKRAMSSDEGERETEEELGRR